MEASEARECIDEESLEVTDDYGALTLAHLALDTPNISISSMLIDTQNSLWGRHCKTEWRLSEQLFNNYRTIR